MLKFLGITSEAPADGSIPAWQGVSKKHRGIAFAISLALGLATFLVTRWLLSDLPPEGYLPLVPWNAAAAITAHINAGGRARIYPQRPPLNMLKLGARTGGGTESRTRPQLRGTSLLLIKRGERRIQQRDGH